MHCAHETRAKDKFLHADIFEFEWNVCTDSAHWKSVDMRKEPVFALLFGLVYSITILLTFHVYTELQIWERLEQTGSFLSLQWKSS